ncbi:B12-binding domain-containing radical SAM protein [Spirochaetia bacterium]|nr:B12-binding domain-containing radical SAM protein [Spirochaetia bacterium]
MKAAPHIALIAVHLESGPDAVPLGAASVASALQAAFPALSVSLLETFVAGGTAAILNIINAAQTKDAPFFALGFSLYSWNRSFMVEAAKVLRSEQPDRFLFCGGPDATALPAGLSAADGGPFDAVVRGEGEAAAVRLLGSLLFGIGVDCMRRVHTPPLWGVIKGMDPETNTLPKQPYPGRSAAGLVDSLRGSDTVDGVISVDGNTGSETLSFPGGLDRLPSPWLDGTLKPESRQGALWELARGCPYSCAYCYESRGFAESHGFDEPKAGKRVRYISDERLLAELRLFIRARTPYIFVLDPTFNTDHQRAVKILDMIERESRELNAQGGGIHWHFEARGELLTKEQARRFARLGASLQIGLQTADPKIAALVGRSFNRGRFVSGINHLNREGAAFGLDLIYGLPGDTVSGFKRSLDFALSLYPNNLDIFRLAVLPGTALADKAAAFGISANPAAPYQVYSTPQFSAADLQKAERLSKAADCFYNRGRAVAWFNQLLYPLRTKPAAFLEGFAEYAETAGFLQDNTGTGNSAAIEKQQLIYLEKRYRKAKKDALIPALRDIVRYHGAWGRALAENAVTEIDFTYHPDAVLGEAALDLEAFASVTRPDPIRAQVRPGDGGAVIVHSNTV